MPSELRTTETVLLAIGVLVLAAVIAGRVSSRSGVPVLVLFLGLGMLAGSEGIGGIHFENYSLTYRIGTLALVLILFDGGLRTPISVVRGGVAPAAALATVGVVVTAGIVAAGARLLGFDWPKTLLLGAIVSSTDAAAVFSVLRGAGVRLTPHIGALVELESGLNDPTAVLLTVTLVGLGTEPHASAGWLIARVLAQLVVGAAVGLGVGWGGRVLLARVHLRAGGLYPAVTVSIALIGFGLASLAFGSGFLAVYVAGITLGNGRLPSRGTLLRVHDFVAWASQVVMFVVLGLLVFPSRVLAASRAGLEIAALLAFIARPFAVAMCLAPFGFRAREVALVGWIGLRGAVPIILAVIPVLAHVAGGERIFDVVFFVVLVSALLQGGTAGLVTKRLGLGTESPPRPAALVEIESTRPLEEEILSFFIEAPCAVCGARIADIPFPEKSFVMLIVRAESLVAPKGDTVLREGDHVFVFCPRVDVAIVGLLFGATRD
jgi:cell volume regulation protein A